jgi:IS30 family transposase
MNIENNTTKERKYTHLTGIDRGRIKELKDEDQSNRQIAKKLGRSPETINREIRRGTVLVITRTWKTKKGIKHKYEAVYDPYLAQQKYDNRNRGGRKGLIEQAKKFVEYLEDKFKTSKWGIDVIAGQAKLAELFEVIPCTKTLYNWIEQCKLGIRNIHLPVKPRLEPRKSKAPKNKKALGTSIEERPEEINNREEVGHWEIDCVEGKKGEGEAVLLTITERKSRYECIIKLSAQTMVCVNSAMEALLANLNVDVNEVFKTITSDNGSEFASLEEALKDVIDVYYAHPYSPWERGTNENGNKQIRKYIPKGESINGYTESAIKQIQNEINKTPRRLLGYKTPIEVLAAELKAA